MLSISLLLNGPMAPYNFQHEAQPPKHDVQNLHDLVFVFFLNLIFHIVLVNVQQPDLQMHRVLSYTTIPPQTSLNFSQLPGHALISPSPGPLYIFLSLPRKKILSTSLIPRPPLRHRSSKKLPCNKHSELPVVATRMPHCHCALAGPAALTRHHEEQALFFFQLHLAFTIIYISFRCTA